MTADHCDKHCLCTLSVHVLIYRYIVVSTSA